MRYMSAGAMLLIAAFLSRGGTGAQAVAVVLAFLALGLLAWHKMPSQSADIDRLGRMNKYNG